MSGISGYRGFLVPFLQLLDGGQSHTTQSVIDGLASALRLTDSDSKQLVNRGRPYTYRNRIIAARTYLLRARFIAYASSDTIVMTEQGKRFLQVSLSEL